MNFIRQIERIQKVNRLIKIQRTGNPDELASSLGISRRQLYNVLTFLKDNGAPLGYSRERQTFYYDALDFDMEIVFSIKPLKVEDLTDISGGFSAPLIQCNFSSRIESRFA